MNKSLDRPPLCPFLTSRKTPRPALVPKRRRRHTAHTVFTDLSPLWFMMMLFKMREMTAPCRWPRRIGGTKAAVVKKEDDGRLRVYDANISLPWPDAWESMISRRFCSSRRRNSLVYVGGQHTKKTSDIFLFLSERSVYDATYFDRETRHTAGKRHPILMNDSLFHFNEAIYILVASR